MVVNNARGSSGTGLQGAGCLFFSDSISVAVDRCNAKLAAHIGFPLPRESAVRPQQPGGMSSATGRMSVVSEPT